MTKPMNSRDEVNGAVVHRQFMFLSGEVCSAWRSGSYQTAHVMATSYVTGQKSAEGIVVVNPNDEGLNVKDES